MLLIPPQAQLALAAGALVVAFTTGWSVNGWRHDAERLQAAQDAAESLRLSGLANAALAARLRASDDLHAAQLQKAARETNLLRDRISVGAGRLLIAATCADNPAPATGVDTGAGAELAASARSGYLLLRDGIDQVEAKLSACQSELSARAP